MTNRVRSVRIAVQRRAKGNHRTADRITVGLRDLSDE